MSWHKTVRTGIGWPVLAGFLTLALGFGGFGAWAAMAPLEGAVIATGKVAVHGRNKVVQHLEGGIVQEILVEEGQRVSAGDPVMILDDTPARAKLNRLKVQLRTFEAIEARALAERSGADAVVFPKSLTEQAGTPEVAKVIEDQRAEFEARLQKHKAEIAVFEQQIAALNEAIRGHESRLNHTRRQIEFVAEERAAFEHLLKRKLATKSKVLELLRNEAELRGREGELLASIAKAKESIAEGHEQMKRASGARLEQASAQLTEASLQRSDVLEQIRAAQDVIERVVVRAPASGTVMNLTKFNSGAVIDPGQEIMEIVPDGSDVVVEAHVRPQDIDEVRIGQPARLSFSAFNPSEAPPVPGEVAHVSADRMEDERTGDVYFVVHLSFSPQPLGGFDPAKVGPGQPVDVFITTGERTFMSYLVDPIMKSLRKGLRES